MSLKQALVTTTFLLLTHVTLAQRDADSSFVNTATASLQQQYYADRKSESLLYVGSDYAEYESIGDEHPFLLTDDWIFGDVQYNGNMYRNVPLQLDLHSQKLLTEHPASGQKIELIREHVSAFTLDGHRFISIGDYASQNNIPRGYYEVLVDGEVRLLTRHAKTFQESTANGKLEVRVEESQKYFLEKNGTFVQVKSKSSLMTALAEKKSALSAEAKRRRMKFSRNKQQAMIELVTLYNSLPHS